jgi:hypothetical protein
MGSKTIHEYYCITKFAGAPVLLLELCSMDIAAICRWSGNQSPVHGCDRVRNVPFGT